jgi:hypothetical protein
MRLEQSASLRVPVPEDGKINVFKKNGILGRHRRR